jgi:putative endonuclease
MAWFIYILKSEIDGDFYKGITENIEHRLLEHNTGQSKFTSTKMPWQLVYSKEIESKKEAIIEEKRIKRLNKKSLFKLIVLECSPVTVSSSKDETGSNSLVL